MNVTFNKYWAHGNFMLIFMQIFQVIQVAGMIPLMWNSEIYLYDFRIWRYLSLGFAVSFILIYTGILTDFVNLVWVESALKDQNPFDVIRAVFAGFFVVFFIPNAWVNGFIILKELSLNQAAWSLEEDYPEGYTLGGTNLDILYYLGVEEDPEWYINWL